MVHYIFSSQAKNVLISSFISWPDINYSIAPCWYHRCALVVEHHALHLVFVSRQAVYRARIHLYNPDQTVTAGNS